MSDDETNADAEADTEADTLADSETETQTAGQNAAQGGAGHSAMPDGKQIGPYKLIRRIGFGGMGVVYEAIQEHPIRRRVALKLIKAGMDTERMIGRFELERQTLAVLGHPAIAKVLDAGATDKGRPYFVMEFVEGQPLDRYCDQKCLDILQRLELLIHVCEGVQHAHQKGIIHRDLKPSNILVEEVDGQPMPRIIDFGIARATTETDSADGLTRLGDFLGTPSYASPEQILGLADIDTRADVYSLGVILYELLAGSLPLDPALIRNHGVEEMLRMIREDCPERPSKRLTHEGKIDTVAERRHTYPSALRREVKADLDWIVMRAIEKERERRYPSAAELASEIRRHLCHEPVLAGPPSVSYRAKKFVRRHRFGVVVAALITLSLIAGVVGTTAAMFRALRAERVARIEAATANNTADFMVEIFDLADPGSARGNTVTAREILDRGVERIQERLHEEPEMSARLLETMGRVYRSLSLYDEAKPLLQKSVELWEGLPDNSPIDTAQVLIYLSGLLQQMGNLDEALIVAEKARALCEQAGEEGTLKLGRIMTNIGAIHLSAKRYEEADAALVRGLELKTEVYGPDHPDVGLTLINLGVLAKRAKRFPEAIEYLLRALPICETSHGEVHPLTAAVLTNLGNTYKRMDDLPEARRLLTRALVIQRRLHDADHADLASSLNALAEVCLWADDLECAAKHGSEALAMRERIFGAEHRQTLKSARTLIETHINAGHSAEAQKLAERFPVNDP